MANQQFRNITYLSDRSGTAKWRIINALQSIDCIAQHAGIQADYSQTPISQPEYYKNMTSVTVQRWIASSQCDMFCKFLKPLMDQSCGWLMYEIDDLMFDGSSYYDEETRKNVEAKFGSMTDEFGITKFNRGRKAFEGHSVQGNIRKMLNTADFVRVTTDFLKEVYHVIYGVPKENILSVPNLLPRYLYSDRYAPTQRVKDFCKNKDRPRVGIVSSLSHYNVDNARLDRTGNVCRPQKQPDGSDIWMNEHGEQVPEGDTRKIIDDIDEIVDVIRDTADDFQWVFFGFCPPCLQDLVDSGRIEVHEAKPIMNYPSAFSNLKLQVVIAPIAKTLFNFSKSFIKYMECAALGIPLLARKCLPYDRVMPADQLYDTADELKSRLIRLKCISSDGFRHIIEKQWEWLNSPCSEGDYNLRNFWMEDNLGIYVDLLRMRAKSLPVSLKIFSHNYEERRDKEKASTVFDNGSIKITN